MFAATDITSVDQLRSLLDLYEQHRGAEFRYVPVSSKREVHSREEAEAIIEGEALNLAWGWMVRTPFTGGDIHYASASTIQQLLGISHDEALRTIRMLVKEKNLKFDPERSEVSWPHQGSKEH
jgi:hypothetical protein